jgi:hypothetical protein
LIFEGLARNRARFLYGAPGLEHNGTTPQGASTKGAIVPKGQDKQAKNNKTKLTTKEKQAKKKEKAAAKATKVVLTK